MSSCNYRNFIAQKMPENCAQRRAAHYKQNLFLQKFTLILEVQTVHKCALYTQNYGTLRTKYFIMEDIGS